MVREDTGPPSESATCAWMAADEAVGCFGSTGPNGDIDFYPNGGQTQPNCDMEPQNDT
ncbi:hypothetical protein NPIL_269491, partial [Nephila pilipes]